MRHGLLAEGEVTGGPGRSGLALGALLALAGCPAAREASPRATLDAYARAIEAGDYGAAYALTSARYRRAHDRDGFERLMRAAEPEARAAAKRLRDHGATSVEVAAEVRYGLGEALPLALEGSRWRIDGDPLDFYPQRSPREAIRSFVRAVERRRYDVVLGLAPARWRAEMTPEKIRADFEGAHRDEVAKLVEALRRSLDAPIEELDGEARLVYGEAGRFELRLLREDGLWRIDKFE